MKILVTGAAGFIGFHLCLRLLELGHTVLGIDNINDYYDIKLKADRLERLKHPHFSFYKMDVADAAAWEKIPDLITPHAVLHMAAQAGVRASITNPGTYIQSNLVGFGNVLEYSRSNRVKHLIYASSSSVYGLNTKMPFAESDNVDHPTSLYAASKRANELMAHTYSHLFDLPTTGLRFFTVYGPWGRPDMALFKFTSAILNNKTIDVYNNGKMQRDFTYIDDIVSGIIPLLENPPIPDPNWNADSKNPAASSAPYRIFNIGNNKPENLEDMIACLEQALGKKANRNYLPLQPGDVVATYANVDVLHNLTGFTPSTPISRGIPAFVAWYKQYYKI